MYKGKRFAALFMSMALATSMLPTNVLAADTADLVLEEQERESQDTMPADPKPEKPAPQPQPQPTVAPQAASADGTKSASCTVTVQIPATKVTLNTTKLYLVKGKSIKIKGKLTPDQTTDKITWKTSKKSVATVKNGKIKAKKTGMAKITATASNGKKAVCKVYVVKKATPSVSIKLNKKKATLKKGKWMLLKAAMKPANATDTVTFKSSNKKVASVDAYGFVTAKKKGKAVITVKTKSGKTATCKITVK